MDSLKSAMLGGCFTAILTATGAAHASPYLTFDIPGAGTGWAQGTSPAAIGGDSILAGTYVDTNNVQHAFFGAAETGLVTFDAPGAGTDPYEGTTANGVNADGVVAGSVDDNGRTHGFVRDASGNFQVFDADNNEHTYAWAINNKGVVTGYTDSEAYVRAADGTITTFSVPGAQATYAMAINGKGVVAGYYLDNSFNEHGFIRSPKGKTLVIFDTPGFASTEVRSIDSKGDVVGIASNRGQFQPFLRTPDGTQTIFSPAGCTRAWAESINFDGVITGYCLDSHNVYHSWVRQPGGTITMYDVPGAGTGGTQGTLAAAIAPNGKSVGFFVDSNGIYHGYRRNADPQP
ncbi:MAG TPA: hypothetical protein VMF58_13985 [Rhizomicrobium sp.]|nr:hypothetical protein [Rhizomicrobium sp.]